MTRHFSKQLVIDACVLRGSGDKDAVDPRPKMCRDFLLAVLQICHRVVRTKDILAEWNHNQSDFGRKWLAQMKSRKKLCNIDNVTDNRLRKKINGLRLQQSIVQEMLKDVHLIEAASKVDLIVVSLDQKIRKIFATNTKNVNEFSKIVWVNPERDSQENPILWLKNGAKLEKERRLEFYLNK